jgi:hypothetical protein
VISVDANAAVAYLNAIAARMAKPQPVLAQIGEIQASKVILGLMSDKDDPEGHAWAEWMPSTRAEREKKGNVGLGLLWDKGTLLGSIRVQTEAREVEIGTRLEEGKFLQEGTKKMEARQFLGWSAADGTRAEELVAAYIMGV